jgi:hypothetical protein
MIRIILSILFLTTFICADDTLKQACFDFEMSFHKNKEEKEVLLSKTIKGFENYIERNNLNNPYIEFNLGTAYLYKENFGKAILHLKRAHLLNPDDNRIVSNLMRAGRVASTPLFANSENDFINVIKQYWANSSLMFLQISSIVFSLFGLVIFLTKKTRGFSKCIFALLFIFFTFAIILKANNYGGIREVVLMSNYNPKSGVGESYPNANDSVLPAGACGVIVRNQSSWVEIKWHNGLSGWVPKSIITLIK